MNDRYLLSVEIIQSLKYFVTPFLNNFQFWITNLFQILPQTTPCNHLSNEMNLLSFLSYPSTDECYNVGMIELFDQLNLWFNSRALWLRQVANINKTPCNFSASIVINTSINSFVGTSSELIWKSIESSSWRDKHDLLFCGLILVVFLISWEKTSFFAFIIFMHFLAFLIFWLIISGFNNFRYLNLVYSKRRICFLKSILLYSIFLI